jgi:hypothetical protein
VNHRRFRGTVLGDGLTNLIAGVLVFAFGIRTFRVRASFGDQTGAEVHNTFRNYRVPWTDVDDVTIGTRDFFIGWLPGLRKSDISMATNSGRVRVKATQTIVGDGWWTRFGGASRIEALCSQLVELWKSAPTRHSS